MVKKFAGRFYVGLVIFFLYAPIFVLIGLSFNASKSRSKWGGFTFDWYKKLFANEAIMETLYTTLIIAFLSALIATIIGTAASVAMNHMKQVPRTILMGVTNIPMLNADIVTGLSLMIFFVFLKNTLGMQFFSLGFTTVLIAHITFNIPYVILSVMPRLRQTSVNTYEAALDLGASPIMAFIKVVLPDIMPGVLSGFLLAFTMSLDDFIITHFTRGPIINTISTKLYAQVRKSISPEWYALSTLLFITVISLLVIINRRNDKLQKQRV